MPWSRGRRLLTHASTRGSWTLTGKSDSVSCGVTAHFSWVLVHTRFCCGLKESVPPVLWKVCSQIPLALNVTADSDCSNEIRCLFLGRKAMTNIANILKSRDITLPTKICIDKAMVFPVVMYGCESWTIKKAECQRSDAFELWCWRRFLRVPWTSRRSNQF